MKILFFSEPWIEMGKPDYRHGIGEFAYQPLIQSILESKLSQVEDIILICGSAQEIVYHDFCAIHKIRLIVIEQKDLRKFVKDDKEYFRNFYPKVKNSDLLIQIASFFKEKIGDFIPDIIIPYSSPTFFLDLLFPDAITFHCEAGFSSRPPFPISIFLDPFGHVKNSYIKNYKSELLALDLSQYKMDWLRQIRKKYIDEIIDAKNPLVDLGIKDQYKFKKYVLLPLQFSEHFLFDLHCDFGSQFQLLCYVMENISPEVGVIVTEHSNALYGDVITLSVKEYLRSKYPNFIFSDEFRKYESCSQYLLSEVDGVVTVQSSVAIQALLRQKPIFVIGNSYLTTIAEDVTIDQIYNFLDSNSYQIKDAVLYHLLTKYYVPARQYLFNSDWISNFLVKSLERHQNKKVDFDFYDEIDNPDKILNLYLLEYNENLPIKIEKP